MPGSPKIIAIRLEISCYDSVLGMNKKIESLSREVEDINKNKWLNEIFRTEECSNENESHMGLVSECKRV